MCMLFDILFDILFKILGTKSQIPNFFYLSSETQLIVLGE